MEQQKVIYRYDGILSFRRCTLCGNSLNDPGDCTNYDEKEENWKTQCYCKQKGIHFHCTKHLAIELERTGSNYDTQLLCPQCNEVLFKGNIDDMISRCLAITNRELFKNPKMIRTDDWYTCEVSEKVKVESDYWIKSDVKTDRDGDTIVVLYVGYKGSKEKVQYFIKPEKGQLTNDHMDLDPSQLLSKIEVTLRNSKLTHEYK